MTGTCPAGTARRTALLGGLAGVVGLGAAACSSGSAGEAEGVAAASAAPEGARLVARPFRGARQAGIVENPQPHAAFVALHLTDGADADAVRRLFTVWTDDIERHMAGRGGLTDQESELAAVPAGLTVTLAVGPKVVALAGQQAPAWLAGLPAFSIDALREQWGPADLLLQICAASLNTVAHTQRRLIKSAGPLVRVAWVQRGFREPYEGPALPMRNLLGQVDGTVQPDVRGADDALLWVGAQGPAWLRDGSALIVRRIEMNLDSWDRVDRAARENVIGRRLDSGAPLTAQPGAGATAGADFDAKDTLGFHVIDDAAHMRRAHASVPHERFLRRPYSYDDSGQPTPGEGSGLIFVAFAADPIRQFVPVQQRLAEKDLLNLWTTPIGSAVFAVLPGAREGEILGQALLG